MMSVRRLPEKFVIVINRITNGNHIGINDFYLATYIACRRGMCYDILF